MTEHKSYLSLDLGKKNIGYSILTNSILNESNETNNENQLIFGLFDIESSIKTLPNRTKYNKVVKVVSVLKQFLYDIIDKYDISTVIIERQVPTNVFCMELMYSIVSIVITKIDNESIIIFDPKYKFTYTNTPYTTKNKQHKTLSIQMTRESLNKLFPDKLESFEKYDKKDDIADSIMMLFIVSKSI